MVQSFPRSVQMFALLLTFVGGAVHAEVSNSYTVQIDGSGGKSVSGDLRLDVHRMIAENFTQSPLQERTARRAALVLQLMGENDKPTSTELNQQMQLHLITIACLRRATTGSDELRDSLVKSLKDTVLNNPTRLSRYNAYQTASKDLKLRLATDNDCVRLEQQAL